MPFRIKVELDDVEGHRIRSTEDLTGQQVTVRLDDGTEVQGHALRRGEDLTGEDTEAHGLRRGIELEVDDTQANMLRAATDRGEPVYVRFPDGAEIKGHALKRT